MINRDAPTPWDIGLLKNTRSPTVMAIVVKFLKIVTMATDMRPKLCEENSKLTSYTAPCQSEVPSYLSCENINIKIKQTFIGIQSFCICC